jgi:hypothetical protein
MKLRAITAMLLCLFAGSASTARQYTAAGWYIVYLKDDGQPEKMAGSLGPYDTQAACQRVFDGAPGDVPETNQQKGLRLAQIFNKMGCVLLEAPLANDQ